MAAATAMALRLNGMSHWVMWEMASLFEHVGTVQDGINGLSRPRTVVDRATPALVVTRGEVRFEHWCSPTGHRPGATGHRRLHADHPPGEKIGWSGRSGAARAPW